MGARHELLPKDLPGELDQKYGSPLAELDGSLPLWLRAIRLGHGWHPLEGGRIAPVVSQVPKLRPPPLAYRLLETARR